MNAEKLIVIIPSYEPTREFVDYAKKVTEFAAALVVVNDGSGPEYDCIFKEIEALKKARYITYGENQGKGYALKEAFRYCTETYDDSFVCVTADCDGQHSLEDIVKVASAASAHPNALILGSRNFDLPNVPKKSKAGNTNIRRMFRLLYGIDLRDTQTGLRGFSVGLARQFLSVRGNRFEYEMEKLIYCQRNSIPISEVPIRTIYPDDPKDHTSHFKAIRDSVKIVGVTFKNLNLYILSSLLSTIFDAVIFFLLSSVILGDISAINTLIATVVARISSSLLNFFLNRKYVFKGKSKKSIYRYYILWLCQLSASYGLIFLFGNVLGLPMTPMKIAGDLILSFFSYQIQRFWVFRENYTNQFYGPYVTFVRWLLKMLTKGYRSSVVPPEEPVVYVCRHLQMHGPITTLVRINFHIHPMVLGLFFDRRECYRQYTQVTFKGHDDKKKKKHRPWVYLASCLVPPLMNSIKAIPVYRGATGNSLQTLRSSLSYLKKGESVIVYPDIDYTAGYKTESELYDGFLLLGQMYKRACGKSLKFVPLYIDEENKMITEDTPITVDNFREERDKAYSYIKSAINGHK